MHFNRRPDGLLSPRVQREPGSVQRGACAVSLSAFVQEGFCAFVANVFVRLHRSLHQSILQRLRDVIRAHGVGSGEVRDRARDLQHPVVAARAEAEAFDRRAQQRAALRVRADRISPPRRRADRRWCARVRPCSASAGAPAPRTRARRTLGRRFARLGVGDRLDRDGRDLDDQIDAIPERTGQAAAILRDLRRRAAALAPLVVAESRTDRDSSRPPGRNARERPPCARRGQS